MKQLTQRFLVLAIAMGCMTFALPSQAQMVVVNLNINQPAALEARAFFADSAAICLGDSVQIGSQPTATGGTQPYSYAWSPTTDLSSSTGPNPMAAPASDITYQVLVTDANNCTSTGSVVVTVSSVPVSAFNFNANGLQVDFIDQSSGTITDWEWDFGDGNFSTAQNPSHTYAAPGQYTVCLTAYNGDCGQESCIVLTVIVGIEDALGIGGLEVFPNPYTGATQVRFEMTEAAAVSLQAFDLQGKHIGTVFEGDLNVGTQVLRFSAADLGAPAGVYLLRLAVGDATTTLRVHELR